MRHRDTYDRSYSRNIYVLQIFKRKTDTEFQIEMPKGKNVIRRSRRIAVDENAIRFSLYRRHTTTHAHTHQIHIESVRARHAHICPNFSTWKGRIQESESFNTLLLVKRKVFDTVVVWYFSLVASPNKFFAWSIFFPRKI